jgi:hypothetical protein
MEGESEGMRAATLRNVETRKRGNEETRKKGGEVGGWEEWRRGGVEEWRSGREEWGDGGRRTTAEPVDRAGGRARVREVRRGEKG